MNERTPEEVRGERKAANKRALAPEEDRGERKEDAPLDGTADYLVRLHKAPRTSPLAVPAFPGLLPPDPGPAVPGLLFHYSKMSNGMSQPPASGALREPASSLGTSRTHAAPAPRRENGLRLMSPLVFHVAVPIEPPPRDATIYDLGRARISPGPGWGGGEGMDTPQAVTRSRARRAGKTSAPSERAVVELVLLLRLAGCRTCKPPPPSDACARFARRRPLCALCTNIALRTRQHARRELRARGEARAISSTSRQSCSCACGCRARAHRLGDRRTAVGPRYARERVERLDDERAERDGRGPDRARDRGRRSSRSRASAHTGPRARCSATAAPAAGAAPPSRAASAPLATKSAWRPRRGAASAHRVRASRARRAPRRRPRGRRAARVVVGARAQSSGRRRRRRRARARTRGGVGAVGASPGGGGGGASAPGATAADAGVTSAQTTRSAADAARGVARWPTTRSPSASPTPRHAARIATPPCSRVALASSLPAHGRGAARRGERAARAARQAAAAAARRDVRSSSPARRRQRRRRRRRRAGAAAPPGAVARRVVGGVVGRAQRGAGGHAVLARRRIPQAARRRSRARASACAGRRRMRVPLFIGVAAHSACSSTRPAIASVASGGSFAQELLRGGGGGDARRGGGLRDDGLGRRRRRRRSRRRPSRASCRSRARAAGGLLLALLVALGLGRGRPPPACAARPCASIGPPRASRAARRARRPTTRRRGLILGRAAGRRSPRCVTFTSPFAPSEIAAVSLARASSRLSRRRCAARAPPAVAPAPPAPADGAPWSARAELLAHLGRAVLLELRASAVVLSVAAIAAATLPARSSSRAGLDARRARDRGWTARRLLDEEHRRRVLLGGVAEPRAGRGDVAARHAEARPAAQRHAAAAARRPCPPRRLAGTGLARGNTGAAALQFAQRARPRPPPRAALATLPHAQALEERATASRSRSGGAPRASARRRRARQARRVRGGRGRRGRRAPPAVLFELGIRDEVGRVDHRVARDVHGAQFCAGERARPGARGRRAPLGQTRACRDSDSTSTRPHSGHPPRRPHHHQQYALEGKGGVPHAYPSPVRRATHAAGSDAPPATVDPRRARPRMHRPACPSRTSPHVHHRLSSAPMCGCAATCVIS